MGTWVATNPETGKKLKVTGDKPPTEAEWDAMFSESGQRAEVSAQQAVDVPVNGEPQPNQSRGAMGFGDIATGAADIAGKGIYEAGKKSLEGLSMLGGFKGVGRDSMPASIANAQAMSASMPEYEMGEDATALTQILSEKYKEYAPEIVKDFLSAYDSLGESVGNKVLDVTGSPLLATSARMIPDAVEAATTLGAANVARQGAKGVLSSLEAPTQRAITNQIMQSSQGDLPLAAASGAANVIGKIQDLSPSQREIKKQLRSGDVDRYVSRYDVSPSGVLMKNPAAKAAEGLGFDTGVISMTRRANPDTRKALRKMVNIKREGRKYIETESRYQPEEVVGSALLDRVDKVKEVNRAAGKALKPIAQSLKGESVDFEPAVKDFMDGLNELGASYDPNTKGLAFTEKSLAGNNPAAKAVLNKIVKYMALGRAPDAYDVHELKIFLDDQLSYGKSAKTGLAGKSERLIQNLRGDIDGALDGKFKDYDEVNTVYAQTITALNDLQSLAGKRMDLSGPRSEATAGLLARRMLQKNVGTNALTQVIDDIEDLATSFGGVYKEDLGMLNRMATELDKAFGTSSPAGFQGGVEAGVDIGMQRGKVRSAVDAGVKGAKKAKEKLFGDSVQDERLKFDVLDQLLRDQKSN